MSSVVTQDHHHHHHKTSLTTPRTTEPEHETKGGPEGIAVPVGQGQHQKGSSPLGGCSEAGFASLASPVPTMPSMLAHLASPPSSMTTGGPTTGPGYVMMTTHGLGAGISPTESGDEDDELKVFLNSLSADQLIQLGKNVASVQKQKLIHGPADLFHPYSTTIGTASPTGLGGMPLGVPLSPHALSPASAPVLHHEGCTGAAFIRFQYPNKGQHLEYSLRADIDHISADELPEDFRRENCVYPRAYCGLDAYVGNRYEYETQVNDIAWRLTWLNRDVLAGKRGLIQRAVDNYRNLFKESRSRRVIRQDKLTTGTLRRRSAEPGLLSSKLDSTDHANRARPFLSSGPRPSPSVSASTSSSSSSTKKSLDIFSAVIAFEDRRGRLVETKIRLNVDVVDLARIDDKFRAANCLFPHAYHQMVQLFGSAGTPSTASLAAAAGQDDMWLFECAINELGWKLAYLNPSKLGGKKVALMAAIDAFRERFEPMHQGPPLLSLALGQSNLLPPYGDVSHHDSRPLARHAVLSPNPTSTSTSTSTSNAVLQRFHDSYVQPSETHHFLEHSLLHDVPSLQHSQHPQQSPSPSPSPSPSHTHPHTPTLFDAVQLPNARRLERPSLFYPPKARYPHAGGPS